MKKTERRGPRNNFNSQKVKVKKFLAGFIFSLQLRQPLLELFFLTLKRKYRKIFLLGILPVCLLSYGCKEKKTQQQEQQQIELPPLPEFNADSAYAFVKAQTDFGPRVPNSKAHIDCGKNSTDNENKEKDNVFSILYR